jgi:hypothetical protein
MDYIREMNAFYDLDLSNQLYPNSISLYFALLNLANKLFWKTDFVVSNLALQSRAGIADRKTFDRCRQQLKDKKLIIYKPSGKVNQAGSYTVVGSVCQIGGKNTTQNDTQNDTQDGVQNDTQNDHISNLNKSNQNKSKNLYTLEFEKWYSEYPRSQSKSDSFKNFEKVRKVKGLEFIWKCTRYYIDHYNSLSPRDQEFAYASNNFLGQKAYYLDFEKEAQNGGSGTIRGTSTKPIYREEDRENEDAWRSKRTP